MLYVHLGVPQGTHSQALWNTYTDKIAFACLKLQRDVRSLLCDTPECIVRQRQYLSCLSMDHVPGIAVRERTAPCGWIGSTIISRLHDKWYINVYHLFHIVVAVHEFDLPMPHGKCDLLQGLELMLIQSLNGLARTMYL